jgi:ABC-type oligopeptide transport system substrate-binding subunit
VSKITPATEVAASVEAAPAEAPTAEATNLESTFFDIDKMLLGMAAEEAAAAAEQTLATVPEKGKEIAEDILEEKGFNFQNIISQELSKAEKEELQEYAISCGYQQERCSLAELTKKPYDVLRSNWSKDYQHSVEECWFSEA